MEIKSKFNILSFVQKQIANYILNNSERSVLLSISDLADVCNTSETTVMRFLKKLGYTSYQVFRVKMAQQVAERSSQAVYEQIRVDDDISQVKNKVMGAVISSVEELNSLLEEETLNGVIDLLSKAKRIIFFGIGGSAVIAMDAYHKFLRLGLNVVTSESSHLMSIQCAHTNKDDVLFLISHSGESKEIIECAKLAAERGAKIIVCTSYKTSSLTKLADYKLLSCSNEAKYLTDAMISRIIQLVIMDIIYVALVLKMGERGVKNINSSRLAVAKSKN